MSNHFLQMYFGLGAFMGLGFPTHENKITVIDVNVPSDPMKDLRLKAEELKEFTFTKPVFLKKITTKVQ